MLTFLEAARKFQDVTKDLGKGNVILMAAVVGKQDMTFWIHLASSERESYSMQYDPKVAGEFHLVTPNLSSHLHVEY